MDLKNLSSNWKKLQGSLKKEKTTTNPSSANPKAASKRDIHEVQHGVKRKRKAQMSEETKPEGQNLSVTVKKKRMSESQGETGKEDSRDASVKPAPRRNSTGSVNSHNYVKSEARIDKANEGLSPTAEIGKYVAIDCEMVGVGPDPDKESVLARVSIVNFNGDQVYDSYVRPKEMVTDWRTHVSGITPKHLAVARELEQVQEDVASILDGRILVGHAVRNDLDALLLGHPKRDIRDTSKYPPYRKVAGGGSPRLKVLAEEFLGLNIQTKSHSSVEDARATMLLYRRDKAAFEREHAKKWPVRTTKEDKNQGTDGQNYNKKKKKKKTTRKR